METRKLDINKISILTPSRERPDRCLNFYNSVLETAKYPDNVELLFRIDNDDPKLNDYIKNIKNLTIGDPISISISWNEIANKCTGNLLIMGNDDQLYETNNWDSILLDKVIKYKDEIYCAWFNDNLHQVRHCAFPIISRKWYNTLGYFSPGIFNFFYNDTWIFDIAKRLDRLEYIYEVSVPHYHWTRSRKMDNTTKRNSGSGKGALDGKIWNETEHRRIEEANKLRQVMA